MEDMETQDSEKCGDVTNTRIQFKNIDLARKAGNLYFLLEELNEYKNYEEEYAKAYEKLVKAFMSLISWRTKRRRNEYVDAEKEFIRLKIRHEHTDVNKLEEEIKEYEKLIDRKFWNVDDLTAIEVLLLLDSAKTIEDAVKLLEERKSDNL